MRRPSSIRSAARRSRVNEGPVRYLLGVCLKNLGDPAAARAAFDRARAVDGALLTANGLPIKDLAQKEITALGGR